VASEENVILPGINSGVSEDLEYYIILLKIDAV